MSEQYTIDELVNMLDAAGIESPYHTDYDSPELAAWKVANPKQTPPYSDFPLWKRLNLDESKLPERWTSAVYRVMMDRRLAKLKAEVDAAVADLPPLLAEFISKANRRSLQMPQIADLRYLGQLAMEDRRRDHKMADGSVVKLGKPPYQPQPGCNLRLKLSQAVFYDYEQASYADHSRYVVPVEGDVTGDIKICESNLRNFAAALRTHTGMAGSGNDWTIELVKLDTGYVVAMDCRASICD